MNRLPVAERRGQLVEAALAVAKRDGIDAATVRAVAAEAGVSLGVVHYCFQDKDELLRAMAHAITSTNSPPDLDQIPDGLPVATVLELAMAGLWQTITSNRGLQLLSYELTCSSLRHEEINQVGIDQYRGQWASAAEVLEAIAAKLRIRWTVPVAMLARLVIAAVDGYSLAWLVDDDEAAAGDGLRAFARYAASLAEPLDGEHAPEDDHAPVTAGLDGLATSA
ncbi:TetR/AcrR family transcriptional regulator [Cellulomonas massiliensis]|uniref:TetR/AcrR family transcriptional regulator n=1 Tax=Cellulomonas massiliensis TaxID=1465811 RepID=UPI00059086D6|nr:TetR/AcrR family transcriptional regulator [Cellulomonas massiliensis]